MSDCPAYLGVTIISRMDQEEILRYDLLIRCPAEFNITFKILNRGLQTEKTFELHLDDLTQNFECHLTQMMFEQNHHDNVAVVEAEAIKMTPRREPSGLIFLAIALSTLISLVMFIAVYVYTEAVSIDWCSLLVIMHQTYGIGCHSIFAHLLNTAYLQ